MNTTKTVPNFDQVQNGVTWIGGYTHQLQKQHIPGYQGHVHGLMAQNVHGKNFARVTAECMNQRNAKGIDNQTKDQKYRSSYKDQFCQPDNRKNQFINTAQSILGKFQANQAALNSHYQTLYAKQPKSIEQVPPIDRIPVVGYMGHRPTFRKPIKQVRPPQQPSKVELPQKKIVQEMLRTGNFDENKIAQINKNIPVVGYCGFLKGVKSQNAYGQTFQQLARTSNRN